MGIPADQIMALTQRCAQAEVDRDKARARVDELSRAYAVQGLAIEELTAERDRYRAALERISRDNIGYAYPSIARSALKEPTK